MTVDSLTAYLQRLPSTVRVSMALESLDDDRVRFYHRADERVPSASVIKLPIMIEAMTAAHDGRLNLDEIHILTESEKVGGSGVLQSYPNRSRISYRDLIRLMVTVSDNTATNILIGDLTREAINNQMRSLGLTKSQLNRAMMDTLATRQGRENYATAREMNQLLTRLYRRDVANPKLCADMLTFLKQSDDTLTIPRLLPRQLGIAHKSGILPYVRADVGIVFAPHPFALSVFVEGAESASAGERIIGELAQLAYALSIRP